MRPNHTLRWLSTAVVTAAVAAMMAGAPGAAASGPCGADGSTRTACPVTGTDDTLTGTLIGESEADYYRFYAKAGTTLTVTITDTNDPSCAGAEAGCGSITGGLIGPGDQNLGNLPYSPPAGSTPPESATNTFTLRAAGVYYVKLYGIIPGYVTSTALGTVPYTLKVVAHPGVSWPAPPACVVPRLAGSTLETVKRRLQAAHCSLGRVTRAPDAKVKRGRVIAASPAAGHRLANDAKVAVRISDAPPPDL